MTDLGVRPQPIVVAFSLGYSLERRKPRAALVPAQKTSTPERGGESPTRWGMKLPYSVLSHVMKKYFLFCLTVPFYYYNLYSPYSTLLIIYYLSLLGHSNWLNLRICYLNYKVDYR